MYNGNSTWQYLCRRLNKKCSHENRRDRSVLLQSKLRHAFHTLRSQKYRTRAILTCMAAPHRASRIWHLSVPLYNFSLVWAFLFCWASSPFLRVVLPRAIAGNYNGTSGLKACHNEFRTRNKWVYRQLLIATKLNLLESRYIFIDMSHACTHTHIHIHTNCDRSIESIFYQLEFIKLWASSSSVISRFFYTWLVSFVSSPI